MGTAARAEAKGGQSGGQGQKVRAEQTHLSVLLTLPGTNLPVASLQILIQQDRQRSEILFF